MKNKIYKAKSPLRYPGGKSKALKKIIPIIVEVNNFEEFREPMVGGGSVFFAIKQIFPDKKYWINDINKNLCLFYKYYKEEPEKLIKEIKTIKKLHKEGRVLYSNFIKNYKKLDNFQKASRFFILNRITFSGLTEAGGYSEEAFVKRFTDSSIQRLSNASSLLKGTKITNKNYSELIKANGKKTFIFLDPPYMSNSKSKLYGKRGCFHEGFNHKKLSADMKKCEHKWLITYDNTPEVRKLFSFAYIYKWKLQYAMNNHNGNSSSKGKELFICNFKIPKEIRKLFVQE